MWKQLSGECGKHFFVFRWWKYMECQIEKVCGLQINTGKNTVGGLSGIVCAFSSLHQKDLTVQHSLVTTISKPLWLSLFFSGCLKYSSIKWWSLNTFWINGISLTIMDCNYAKAPQSDVITILGSNATSSFFSPPSHTGIHPAAFAESC